MLNKSVLPQSRLLPVLYHDLLPFVIIYYLSSMYRKPSPNNMLLYIPNMYISSTSSSLWPFVR